MISAYRSSDGNNSKNGGEILATTESGEKNLAPK
jgi:hypothetical protein